MRKRLLRAGGIEQEDEQNINWKMTQTQPDKKLNLGFIYLNITRHFKQI